MKTLFWINSIVFIPQNSLMLLQTMVTNLFCIKATSNLYLAKPKSSLYLYRIEMVLKMEMASIF